MTGLWHKISQLEQSVKRLWLVSLLNLLGWVALLAFMLLQMGCTNAVAVDTIPDIRVFVADLSKEGNLAQVVCDSTNVPQVLFDTAQITVADYPFVRAHELRHIQQMWDYPGGCKAAKKAYDASRETRLRLELEAECAAIVSNVEPAQDSVFIARRTAVYYNNLKYPKLTKGEVFRRFKEACNRERG